MPQNLDDEERIAVGLRTDRVHQGIWSVRLHDYRQQLAYFLLIESPEDDAFIVRLAPQGR